MSLTVNDNEHGELFEYVCAVLRDPASYTQEHVESLEVKISALEMLDPEQKSLLLEILAKLSDWQN